MLEKDVDVWRGECRKKKGCRGRDNEKKVDGEECDVEDKGCGGIKRKVKCKEMGMWSDKDVEKGLWKNVKNDKL